MDGENWPPLRDSKVEVSSVSPSSEWIEESWVLSGLYTKLKIKRSNKAQKKKVKIKETSDWFKICRRYKTLFRIYNMIRSRQ